ncbi:MAG TPA: FGGY-family carbohydrate kinase [Terracidiphilus sp.]|nr:FGGY-family carbohydrate kinase [Terracidiphilus sp.]
MNKGQALVAIDLGAESCRVSMLRRIDDAPEIRMVRRFANGPVERTGGIYWDLDRICRELNDGLRQTSELAPEGIASIGVTGWAVDYVRLNAAGAPLGLPHCYRDPRNAAAMGAAHGIVPAERLYARTGVQIQPINTIYQLFADTQAGIPAGTPWVNLPEYILHWLGAPLVAEYTNATHTGLVDPETRSWAGEIFRDLGLDCNAAPQLVQPGTLLGPLRADLRCLRGFGETVLIAPACHDTASAVAGIPANDDFWAYISSGTWSLVGVVDAEPHRSPGACACGFTNLGAAGGRVLFHRGLVGMWLLRQCLNTWDDQRGWDLSDLIAAARKLPAPDESLDLDDVAFVTPGDMPARMNEQRRRRGLRALPEGCDAAPHYANLIFHSLAHRYGAVLREIEMLTGKQPRRICVVGGGNRNDYLNTLTENATGLPVVRCAAESSTLGNFAVQLARLEQDIDEISESAIRDCASKLLEIPMNG